MQAIIPQPLKILNDSVPEDEAPLWDAESTYAKGDEVIDDHKIYRALTENTGKQPSITRNSTGGDASWAWLGVTNKYACIDLQNYTQTTAPEGQTTLVIEIPFERPAVAAGLLNIDAAMVHLELVASSGDVAWESGEVTLQRDSSDWWDYYFGGYRQDKVKVFFGIPPVSGILRITLYGGRPAIGNILIGEHVTFGLTEYGVRTGFIDYSINTEDSHGNTVWMKRRNAKRGTFPVFIDPADLDYVQQTLADLSGNPALWIGDNGTGFQSMIIYGFLREFDGGLDAYSRATGNFEIRGII